MNSLIERLKLLETNSYLIECLALNYTGEARSELSLAIKQLGELTELSASEIDSINNGFQEAYHALQLSDEKAAATPLNVINRNLWNVVMDTLPLLEE